MGSFRLQLDGRRNLAYAEIGGHRRYMGARPTPLTSRMALPRYQSEVDLIPRSEWKDFSIREQIVPRITDQDGYSACVDFGATAAFELAWRVALRPELNFANFFLYPYINGGVDAGANVGDSLRTLVDKGVCLEGDVPYGTIRLRDVPAAAVARAKRFHPEIYYWAPTFDEGMSAVLRGHTWCFGIDIGSAFSPGPDGRVPQFRRGRYAGHCMYACGLKFFGGTPYADCPNSWSTTWGLNGSSYIPESYFAGGDNYVIVCPGQDPEDPNPPPTPKE